ncbi:hypothetical protein SAMN05421690_10805 [Nitrosomonas sp. Nm51]|nr:hypothetical protein SAMN05421690_10805 [Nitrosomonas sp. Nm51]
MFLKIVLILTHVIQFGKSAENQYVEYPLKNQCYFNYCCVNHHANCLHVLSAVAPRHLDNIL